MMRSKVPYLTFDFVRESIIVSRVDTIPTLLSIPLEIAPGFLKAPPFLALGKSAPRPSSHLPIMLGRTLVLFLNLEQFSAPDSKMFPQLNKF